MHRVTIVTATVVLSTAQALGSTTSAWTTTAASSVTATATKSGVAIAANVELANNCYEARVAVAQRDVRPKEYVVQTRVKPEDVGKLCGMVIIPSVAKGSFVAIPIPVSVTVHAKNKTFHPKVARPQK